MPEQDKLSEKWPWNGEFLRLFLLLPSAIAITATVSTYPFAGVESFWFLLGIPVGVLLYFIYGSVGVRIEKLIARHAEDNGELAEGLIVIGKVQSPGIVIYRDNEIELIPIAGNRQVINLADTTLIGEGHWLPGKYVWGKRVFTYRSDLLDPLAFAVPESFGARWSSSMHARHSK